MNPLRCALVACCVLVSIRAAVADDWPYFRGPHHNGISTEKGWDPAKAKKVWTRQVGTGCASVAVIGDRVYTMGYDVDQREDVIYCLNSANGQTIWKFGYPAKPWSVMHDGGPASTPAVVDGRVFTVSRDGALVCVDAIKGTRIWAKDLKQDYGVNPPKWGFAGSVLPYDGKIYVDVGRILCLNPADGAEIWATKNYGEAYSTPAPFDLGNIPALAVFPESGLVILRRDNGKHGGDYGWTTSYGVNAAAPVIVDESDASKLVFISSGYNVGGALIRLGNGQVTRVWDTKDMRNHMSTSILYKDQIYGFDDNLLKCLDLKTGARRWTNRDMRKGALSMADGKLIVISENGQLVIAEATPEGFAPVVNEKAVDDTCWVMPVLANGKIYAKSNTGHLTCFDLGG